MAAERSVEYDAPGFDPEEPQGGGDAGTGTGFGGRKRGVRRYTYTLAEVQRLGGYRTPAALWKALARAGVSIDDFDSLVRWLFSRLSTQAPAAVARRHR